MSNVRHTDTQRTLAAVYARNVSVCSPNAHVLARGACEQCVSACQTGFTAVIGRQLRKMILWQTVTDRRLTEVSTFLEHLRDNVSCETRKLMHSNVRRIYPSTRTALRTFAIRVSPFRLV